MAIELFKVYGFQPKQFEILLKELKESKHLQNEPSTPKFEETKQEVASELTKAFQEKQQKI